MIYKVIILASHHLIWQVKKQLYTSEAPIPIQFNYKHWPLGVIKGALKVQPL